jgi:hypothetical protein
MCCRVFDGNAILSEISERILAPFEYTPLLEKQQKLTVTVESIDHS